MRRAPLGLAPVLALPLAGRVSSRSEVKDFTDVLRRSWVEAVLFPYSQSLHDTFRQIESEQVSRP